SFVLDGDLHMISEPVDFVGINNYSRAIVGADGETGDPIEVAQPDVPRTGLGWEVYPDGICEVLMRLHRDYGVQSLYVTANGAAYPTSRSHDGEVRDVERIAYLEAYISSIARALENGVPVRGYFVWSLLDNFEWARGYSQRFGIVYVDYPTLER